MKFKHSIIASFILVMIFSKNSLGQSSLTFKTISSQSLANNMLDIDTNQKVAVYLPPTYKKSNLRYPVVYYLPGFTSPIHEYLFGEYSGFELQIALDSLIKSKTVKEMIVVLIDGNTFLGGSFYVNSAINGNWENYIAFDVVQYLDGNFRTIPSAKSRGIVGNLMGGFGALNIAMKYPDIFGTVYSLSPGLFDTKGILNSGFLTSEQNLNELKQAINIYFECNDINQVERYDYLTSTLRYGPYKGYLKGFLLAYGSAFCSEIISDSPPFFNLPTSIIKEGNIKDAQFKCWINGFGNWNSKIQKYKSNLQQLNIILDCGLNDGWITDGTQNVSNLFEQNQIQVKTLWFDGGHTDKLHIRLKEHMFPTLSHLLEFKL